jgi:D-alanyl-D-alanine carboxypeptidase
MNMYVPQPLKRVLIFTGVLFCAVTTLFIFSNIPRVKSQSMAAKPQVVLPQPVESTFAASYFKNTVVQAKAVYIADLTTGQPIYAKNENTPLPLASLTKIMTMLLADSTVPKDTVVSISQQALDQDGDNGLVLNEQWRLKDLMDFSLMVSSNDGAEAIGETTDATINRESDTALPFSTYMNREAKVVGMQHATFLNANGLDINIPEKITGGTASAKDMEMLLSYVLKNNPDVIDSTNLSQRVFTSLSGKTHVANNTDLIINQLPDVIASKTGYTVLAGGNLALAFDPGLNEPIIIVLLGSTENGRFTDMLKLASSTRAYLSSSAENQFMQSWFAASSSIATASSSNTSNI